MLHFLALPPSHIPYVDFIMSQMNKDAFGYVQSTQTLRYTCTFQATRICYTGVEKTRHKVDFSCIRIHSVRIYQEIK